MGKKIGLILLLIAAITVLHYATPLFRSPLHILYRELYFIPIVLAGWWGGKKWGLGASIGISLLYLPHIFSLAQPSETVHHMNVIVRSAESYWGNAFQLIIFNLVGFLVGGYSDLKKGFVAGKAVSYTPTEFKKNFLLFVEDSQVSLYAAKYFADIFGKDNEIDITLVWVTQEAEPDYFETDQEAVEYEEKMKTRGTGVLEQVRNILLENNIPASRIHIKYITAERGVKISDELMQILSAGNYDTIIIGKHHLTKSQEFFFGSVAVNLVRHSPINVLTVKRPNNGQSDNG